MNKMKAITAGAIALTLAIGGGSLWAGQYVNAATASDKQLVQAAQADYNAAKKAHGDKRGNFGRGFEQLQEQLIGYLGLDAAALQTKLKTLTLSEIAVEQGKTRAELKEKLVGWLEAAEAAVPPRQDADSAVDVDKEADAGKQHSKPDAATLADKWLDSHGFGLGKHGDRGGFGGSVNVFATALGLTEDELKAELASGKTLAALASEKGVVVQTLIDLSIKDKQAKLKEELAAGTITQEQYDARLTEATEHVTKQINGEHQAPGEGKSGHGGKGPRGERPDGAAPKKKSSDEASTTDSSNT